MNTELEVLEYVNSLLPEDKRFTEEEMETARNDGYDALETDDLIWVIEGNFKCVSEEFEEGGRWYNFQTYVFNIGDRYIEVIREVPASETQEGMDLSTSYAEVVPKEITKTIYVSK